MRYVASAAAVLLFGLSVAYGQAAKPDPKKDPDKDPRPDVKKDLDKPDPKKDLDKPAKPDPKKDLDKPAKSSKPDVKKDLDTTTPKMIKAGQLQGKIVAINESKKSIRLSVTVSIPKLDQGQVNALLQAQAEMQQALYQRDPRQRLQQMQQAQIKMLQAKARLYTAEQKTQDVELATIDDVKVRQANPPVQFDEKGGVKRYTAKELKELRGKDLKLPGYNAEFSDLQQGQVVAVTLVKNKDAPRAPRRKPGKDKDADPDLLADNLPQVSMIVILQEPKTN